MKGGDIASQFVPALLAEGICPSASARLADILNQPEIATEFALELVVTIEFTPFVKADLTEGDGFESIHMYDRVRALGIHCEMFRLGAQRQPPRGVPWKPVGIAFCMMHKCDADRADEGQGCNGCHPRFVQQQHCRYTPSLPPAQPKGNCKDSVLAVITQPRDLTHVTQELGLGDLPDIAEAWARPRKLLQRKGEDKKGTSEAKTAPEARLRKLKGDQPARTSYSRISMSGVGNSIVALAARTSQITST